MIKTFNENEYVVEPANVQSLRYVRTINLANAPRLNVLAPPGVTDPNTYGETNTFVEGYAVENSSGIVGDVGLIAGFNCSIFSSGNEVTISAYPGAGMSAYEEQPAEIPVTEEENQLVRAGKYLSRGRKCNELIESINGLFGDNINISSGSNVKVSGEKGVLTFTIKSPDETGDCK